MHKALSLLVLIVLELGAAAAPGSGLEIDVRAHGAAGDGIADDTAALQKAIDSLPGSGGVVQLPPGTYKITATLTLGNATATTPSTRNGIALRGAGFGVAAGDLGEANRSAPTRIVWAGAPGGTMVRINGPASGMAIQDLMLDAAGIAGTGIDSARSFDQYVGRVKIARWTGIAIIIRANNAFKGPPGGGAPREHLWEQVQTVDPGSRTASALQIAPERGNANELLFIRCLFERGDSDQSYSLELGYCDHVMFVSSMLLRRGGFTGIGIKVRPHAENPSYPQNVTFYGTPVIGGVLVEGSWQFILNPALIFLPYYTADAEPVPPAGANKTALPRQLASGITDTGIVIGYTHELMGDAAAAGTVTPPANVFSMSGTATVSTLTNPPTTYNRSATRIWIRPTGEWTTDTAGNIGVAFRARVGRVVELVWDTDTAKWWPVGLDDLATPLLYSSVSASGAIGNTTAETPFSKTYTLPANTLSVPGTVVRIRASGVYSAAGAPSLEIRTKLGPHVVCAAEQTAATGAQGYSWMATCDLVARTAGASAAIRGAGGILGLGSTNVVAGGYTSEVHVDTTAAQPVSVTAEWSGANAVNTITLESLTVEVLYPGAAD